MNTNLMATLKSSNTMPGFPLVHLIIESSQLKAQVSDILFGIPFAYTTLESLPSLFKEEATYVCVFDWGQGKRLLEMSGFPELYESRHTSFICLSDVSLLNQEKDVISLYENGFQYVFGGLDDKKNINKKIAALLETKSRVKLQIIASQMLSQQVAEYRNQQLLREEFFQMAVHDLRSPLSAMVCYAELLMEGVLGNLQASQLEPIRTIHRNCQFLIDMVSDLLDSAKMEAGKTQLKLSSINFKREVELVIDSLKGLADAKSIEIENYSDETPRLFLDGQKVNRILSNLLGNAIKFTKINGTIITRLTQKDNTLIFSIQDTGPGIAEADLNSIFEKFQIGENSHLKGKGHGLGLAITKSFVEMHRGKLFVESIRNKGSTFIVHLPIEKRAPRIAKQFRRCIAVVDLEGDWQGLYLHEIKKAGIDIIHISPDHERGAFQLPYDVACLIVNEKLGKGELSSSSFLLGLSMLAGGIPFICLSPAELPEFEREIRRSLGFVSILRSEGWSSFEALIRERLGRERREKRKS